MRKVADPAIADRLTVTVDHDAEPVDVDAALAKFLLAFVRSKPRSLPVTPAAAVEFSISPEAERQMPCFLKTARTKPGKF
jgi:hypothetical protein